MTQNMFAGGPNISENPPDRLEEAEINEVSQPKTQPGAGLYQPFQETDTSEEGIERAFFDIPRTEAVLGGEEPARDTTESIWENDELTSIEITELPETPFIERLVDDEVIPQETASALQTQLWEGRIFLEAVQTSQIPGNIQTLIIQRWEDMNNPESTQQNIGQFDEDFWWELLDIKDEKGGFVTPRTEEAFEMVGSAYLVWTENSPVEKKQALNMAFETAANKAVDGKIFTRSILFEENMWCIKNTETNPNERIHALIKVLEILDTDQGAKSSKRADSTETPEETLTNIVEEAGLSAEFEAAQKAVEAAQQGTDAMMQQQAQQELTQIVQKAEELTGTTLGTFSMGLEIGGSEAGQEVLQTRT